MKGYLSPDLYEDTFVSPAFLPQNISRAGEMHSKEPKDPLPRGDLGLHVALFRERFGVQELLQLRELRGAIREARQSHGSAEPQR